MEDSITCTQQLQLKLDEIKNILIELNRLKIDIKLLIDKDQVYFLETTSKSSFYYRLHLNYIRLFVIDFYKLVAPNEHFNFGKLLSFCKINRRNIQWSKDIDNETLDQLEKDFKSIINQHYKDIYNLRNKFYAHSDKNKTRFEKETRLKLIKLWETLDVLNDVFIKINSHFRNEDCRLLFNEDFLPKPKEIEDSHKYKQLRELFFQGLRGNKEDLNYDEVKKIIIG